MPAPAPPFPIVGIGASAGGLEALELFLRNVPAESGMGFVIVQHLDPAHKGSLVELLQRASAMSVVEVEDRQRVEPDSVYVIPPGKDMSILHGVLHVLPQTAPRGLNLPIDYFFRSLAEDRREAGIAVVLSGMGSDGTLGLRAIKEKAGATFVQSLSSAKFDGMPRSAIDAGLADVIASVEDLPKRIIAYLQHVPFIAGPERAVVEVRKQSALEKIFILLRAQSGNDFSLYKRSTVERRIERRMGLHQIDTLDDYVRYLRDNPREIELLFKELLIGVTNFFRDPEAWETLRQLVLPELIQARAEAGVLRAWVPACSTGEEAYSLAIVLSEAIEALKLSKDLSIQIFATDLDREAIDKARLATYPANIAADVSPERLRRFFIQDNGGYRLRKDIRETVVFAPQNIITDPPFTKLDILSCRNLLIYLSAELQKKLLPLFHYSLNPSGILFLGSAETVGSFTGLFTTIEGKSRLYRRLETSLGAPLVEFPSAFVPRDEAARQKEGELPEVIKSPGFNLQMLADRVIVQRFSPAAILTSEKGDILYIGGRTGKYLEPAVGRANLNIFAMAREGLRFDLSSAFAAALREERPITVRGIKVRTNGSAQIVDLTVQRLNEPRDLRGTVIIVITDVATVAAEVAEAAKPAKGKRTSTNKRALQLERELQEAIEEGQTVREEMQTSQEELKSINEELQSTNEELQSTNEELTTSKEEMQSMNEELQTVNHELQSKIDDLARSNNDMRNLLNSTEVATLFLDSELLVRRFTTQTTKIIKLIPSDAGRPITDITTDLDYPSLADDAREVLRTLVFKETQVSARDGRWFQVRIMPYRTLDNVIDGLVITFSDSTAVKNLEKALREQATTLRQMAESLPTLVWSARADGGCDYLSRQWVEYTGVAEAEQHGYGWLEQVHPEDRERVREEWKGAVKAAVLLDTSLRLRAKDGSYRYFKTSAVPIRDQRGAVTKWYGTHTDIDELKRTQELSRERRARIREWIDEAALVLDDELAITRLNAAAERTLGRPRSELIGRRIGEVMPEVAGTPFESQLREALRARRDVAFEASFERTPYAGSYAVLGVATDDGFIALLKRSETPGGGAP